jgi:GMP synthase (glutamine-hydrolysing)
MARPFLILQLRPEDEASDNEFEAILAKGHLAEADTRRIRLDQERLPEVNFAGYAGIIIGGGPGCVSDPPEQKDPVEARIEAEMLGLMPEITARDFPFLGCCYGIGILAHHLSAEVSKRRYGEPVGGVDCMLTQEGRLDPLLQGVPQRFRALVGHKEAVQELPHACVHLVESLPCPFQMIRHGANVYATQFHPEADAEVFATRIRIYRNHGYFPPEEAEALTASVRGETITAPELILRNFVARYG